MNSNFTRRDLFKLIIESGLIVFSVFLGLGLNELRSNYKMNLQVERAIEKITVELKNNLETVNAWLPYHQQVLNNFENAFNKSKDPHHYFSADRNELWQLMPKGVVQALIDDTAWQSFRVSSVFSNLQFDRMVILSKIYKLQKEGVEVTIKRISDVLISRESLRAQNARENLILLKYAFAELVAQETYLIKSLNTTLDELKSIK